MGQERRLPMTRKILQGRAYRSVQTDRAKFTRNSREKQDERDGGEFEVRGLRNFESRLSR